MTRGPRGFSARLGSLSIRARLVLLVLAVAVPLAGTLAYVLVQDVNADREKARQSSLAIARLSAASVEEFIDRSRNILREMVKRPLVRAVDPGRCDPILKEFTSISREFANIGVVDLRGRVICSAVPQRGGRFASVAGTEWYRTVRRTDAFTVGEPFVGPITGKWVSVLAQPVHDARGRLVGMLGLPIDLVRYRTAFGSMLQPEERVTTIIDRRGVVVARSRDPGKWVGRNVRETEIVSRALAEPEGTDVVRGVDGIKRVYGFTTVPASGWIVYSGIPTSAAFAEAAASARRAALLGTLSLLLAAALAFLFRRGIQRPVDAVAAAVRAVGDGDFAARAPVAGPAEIALVAESFNAMVDVRVRANEELLSTMERLRAILEASPLGIAAFDLGGRPLLWSPAAERELGWTAADLDTERDQFVAEEYRPRFAEARRRVVEESRLVSFETVLRRKDGTAVDAWVSVGPLRGADGGLAGLVTVIQDLTERKRLEAQALQSQKLDTVGRLAGGIAHDFNNLLTAIGGYLDLLLAQLAPDDPRRGDAEEARLATQRAAELTQGLLAFARKSEIAPRLVDVNEIVAGIVPMLRRLLGEHIAVETSLDGGPTVVRADPGRLEQALVNFAVNAAYAMPGGGTVSIATASTPESVVLTVRDTGHGMDAETKAHLFEPFFTTKEQGTGLGLATVYGIVAQAGGTIDVESEPGHGTAFAVTLPRANGAQATAEAAVVVPPRRRVGARRSSSPRTTSRCVASSSGR